MIVQLFSTFYISKYIKKKKKNRVTEVTLTNTKPITDFANNKDLIFIRKAYSGKMWNGPSATVVCTII
jgi:hypothetical protein